MANFGSGLSGLGVDTARRFTGRLDAVLVVLETEKPLVNSRGFSVDHMRDVEGKDLVVSGAVSHALPIHLHVHVPALAAFGLHLHGRRVGVSREH